MKAKSLPPPTLPTSLRCCRAFDPSAALAAVGVSPPARLKYFKRLCLHSRMENFDLTRLAAPFCTFDKLPACYKWSVSKGHCGDNEHELNAGSCRRLSLNHPDGFWLCGVSAEKESCAHFKRHADSLLYIATIFIPSYITDINSLKWVSGFACRDGVGAILPTHEEYGDVHLKLI